MKFNAILLVVALVALGAMASAQEPTHNRRPQCTPEPISMIGLGVAGLGLLRAKFKKSA